VAEENPRELGFGPSGRDRRKAARAQLLVRVEHQTPESTYTIGECENISETGIWVKTKEKFAISQEVTLRFILPPVAIGIAVQTRGVVVRVQESGGVAFEFVELKPRFRDAIAKYVQRSANT
jgi:hypothetical protein